MGIHDGHRAKMRRRFCKTGLDSFADHEALELLLFYAIPRRDTNETAHRLLNQFGSLEAIFSASVEELKKVEGIGESSALLLKLTPEIVKKSRLSDNGRDIIINSSEQMGEYLLERFRGERNEVVYQLCLDRKGKLLDCCRVSEGSADRSDLSVRRMVENALNVSASVVVLAHNHPSGIALPSEEDYAATDHMRKVLKMIGVELVDHIIVADNDYVSMADSGMLARY